MIASLGARLRRILRVDPTQSGAEHGQALMRIAVSTCIIVYLLAHSFHAEDTFATRRWVTLASVFMLFATAHLAWVVLRPGQYPVRQMIGAMADLGVTSYCMLLTSEVGAPLFAILLWITLGNGFRYGTRMLYASMALGVAGFSVVVWRNPFWHDHLAVSGGLGFALLIVPMYAAHLIRRLHAALDAADKANKAKTAFVATISHELRTPLHAILSTTELLAGGRLASEERGLLKIMRDSVETLLAQVNSILDFAKLEAGKTDIECIDFDLYELVHSTVSIMRPRTGEKGLDLTVRIDPEVPCALAGDPHHIKEVLLNLVSNAVKFTARGRVCVMVTSVGESGETVRVRIEVRDTGIGISAEALPRIFESFTQADGSTTRRYGGTGLGTTIARDLVRLMGGEIGAQSTEGEGSTFWFELPLSRRVLSDAERLRLERARVLVVSGTSELVGEIARLQADDGGNVLTAGSLVTAATLVVDAARDQAPIHLAVVGQDVAMDADNFSSFVRVATASSCVVAIATVSEVVGNKQISADLPVETVGLPMSHDEYRGLLRRSPLHEIETGVSVAVFRRSATSASRARKVLVADDNQINRQLMARMLAVGGYDVLPVEDGEKALEALLAGGIELAILDMHMPLLTGVSVARQLRQLQPDNRVPIVLLTADVTVEAKRECEAVGACYLSKPVRQQTLLAEIQRLLREAVTVESIAAAPRTRDVVLIDSEQWGDLVSLYSQNDGLGTLVRTFRNDTNNLLERMGAALATLDHAGFSEAAHAIKGNAGSIAAKVVQQRAQAAELMSFADFMAHGKSAVQDLRALFERTLEAFALELSSAQDVHTKHSTRDV